MVHYSYLTVEVNKPCRSVEQLNIGEPKGIVIRD